MNKVARLESVKALNILNYGYNLPNERIAKYPLPERDGSKLLCYNDGKIEDYRFNELCKLISDDSLMLYNNTRVIHARLYFQKSTGATIEVFCLSPFSPSTYLESFEQRERVVWTCLVGNARRWKDDVLQIQVDMGCDQLILYAEKLKSEGGEFLIEFTWNNPQCTFSEVLEKVGELPIPPYLNRETELIDNVSYQTVYSSNDGSVAAPTAGLHFTSKTFEHLEQKGIKISYLTLHVGAGTFRPVKAGRIVEHEMHTEVVSFSRSLIEDVLSHNGDLITVGTTSLRALESLYYIGEKVKHMPDIDIHDLEVSQWEAYEREFDLTGDEALEAILEYMDRLKLNSLSAKTQIMIAPGFQFRYSDVLLTNFHQPRSTLLLLVAAFVGEDWRRIYEYALTNGFRFLSYGDSSLIWRNKE